MACVWSAAATVVESSYGLVDTDMADQMHGRHDHYKCQLNHGTCHPEAYMDVRVLKAGSRRDMVGE